MVIDEMLALEYSTTVHSYPGNNPEQTFLGENKGDNNQFDVVYLLPNILF